MSKFLNPLQGSYLAEHKRWCVKACDANALMQEVGKPEDLPLGVSIVDYALDRLIEDLKHQTIMAKGGE